VTISFRTGSASAVTSAFTDETSYPMTLSSSIVAGDLVIVGVAVANVTYTATTISLSGGGVTWTPAGTVTLGGSSAYGTAVDLLVFTAAATGSTPGATVTATPGGSSVVAMVAASYPGAVRAGVYATTTATASGGVTTLTEPSATTAEPGDWIIDIIALWTVSTATVTLTYPSDAGTSRVTAGTADYQILALADSNGTVAEGGVGGHSWSWTGNADGVGALLAIKGPPHNMMTAVFP
jgi:hypothetical protein